MKIVNWESGNKYAEVEFNGQELILLSEIYNRTKIGGEMRVKLKEKRKE